MAIEIANLLARITYQVDGAAQAAEKARQVADSIDATGTVARSATDGIRLLADNLESLGGKATQAADNLQVVNDAILKSGLSYDEAVAKSNAYGEAAQAAGERVRVLAEEIRALQIQQAEVPRVKFAGDVEAYRAELDVRKEQVVAIEAVVEAKRAEQAEAQKSVDAAFAEQAAISGLVEAYEALPELQDKVNATARAAASGEKTLGREVERVTRTMKANEAATKGVDGASRKAQRGLRGLWNELKNINNGSILSARSLASLAGRLTKFGVVATLIMRGLQKAVQWFLKSYEDLASVSTLPNLTPPFEHLSDRIGAADSAVQKLISSLDNLARSKGIMGISDDVAGLAEQISGMFAGAGASERFDQALKVVQGAVIGGNISGLTEATGINESEIQAQIKAYQEVNGYVSEQEAIMLRLRLITAALAKDSERFAAANEKGLTSVSDVKASALKALAPIMKALAPAFEAVLKALKKALDYLVPFFQIWAKTTPIMMILKGLLFLVAKGLENLATVLKFVMEQTIQFIRTFEPLLQAVSKWPVIGAAAQSILDVGEAMERALAPAEALGDGMVTLGKEFGTASERFKTFISDAKGGFSVGDAVVNLGKAINDMEKKANPQTAIAYAKAWTNAFDTVANDGIPKLKALRDFINEQFKAGHIGEEARDEVLNYVDLSLKALAPMEGQVNALKDATDTGTAKVQTLNEGLGTTSANVVTVTGQVRDFKGEWNSIESKVVTLTVIQDMQQRFSTSGGGGVPTDVTGAPQINTTGPFGFTTPSDREKNRAAYSQTLAPKVAADRAQAQAEASWKATQKAVEANTAAVKGATTASTSVKGTSEELAFGRLGVQKAQFDADAAAEAARLLALQQGALGGSGGGDKGLDFDAIRKFMQEVNRAISIASNQGVRIGTAGNAIPFEPGSFVNAEGGNLSVDTILIRGVWDFADPAAKRLIVRELQDALKALQAEI